MLSIILYGRNDNYGYNLHKRAALSLNCMAELLGSPGDEILFVDYNTPDDYPTFPEAIRDTLTERARRRLRIFRVRPAHHARYRSLTRLLALEPIARNVALRRSNPDNRWVLSTNTDMIFVPRGKATLGEITADLEGALYHIPRFEIPETLWEGFDRMDPGGTIAEAARSGWELHLNEIVYGSPAILFDAPGDFQLAPRNDLFRIDGFDERMLLGWHVDSNLSRRLGFLYGAPRSLADRLFGYHCDHTRQVTPAHRHDRTENNSGIFVDGMMSAEIPEQRESWGLAGEKIEEIRLADSPGRYLQALRGAIGEAMAAPTEISYSTPSFGTIGYDSRHVLPFLLDAVASYPPETTIGWIGSEPDLLERFLKAWRGVGATGKVLVPTVAGWLSRGLPDACLFVSLAKIAESADLFVADFGQPVRDGMSRTDPAAERRVAEVALWFRRLVAAERAGGARNRAARRFIAVNVVHGPFESMVTQRIGAALAPIATRLRQGFVLPETPVVQQPGAVPARLRSFVIERFPRLTRIVRRLKRRLGLTRIWEPGSILSELQPGTRGRRRRGTFAARKGREGFVFYGAYRDLEPAHYRLRVRVGSRNLTRVPPAADLMVLEVLTGSYYLAWRTLTGRDLAQGEVVLDFSVSEELLLCLQVLSVEFRLFTRGRIKARVRDVILERTSEDGERAPASANWLALMYVGLAGIWPPPASLAAYLKRRLRRRPPVVGPRAGAAGVAAAGVAGCVLCGPYASLLPGAYRVEFDLAPPSPHQPHHGTVAAGEIRLDVVSAAENLFLAGRTVPAGRFADGPLRFEFTVPDRLDNGANPMRLEFRVSSSGGCLFLVRGVRIEPLALPSVDERRLPAAAGAIPVRQ